MKLILTLNAGSSSLKFALFEAGEDPREICKGQVENIGSEAVLKSGDIKQPIGQANHGQALEYIMGFLSKAFQGQEIIGVGHRIVHGGTEFDKATKLENEVIAQLEAYSPLAPLHQPHNLAVVKSAQIQFPFALHIGCFDTAFHRGHPFVNDAFALPRRFYEQGVRRYGFHGLSYDYITSELLKTESEFAKGRVIIAHLGNGASICATRSGRSIASTMGFSALDGLPMGTRCGQLDPGVVLYLSDQGMSAREIETLLYQESGLKGLSGLSHDMRDLQASSDPHAKEAIDYFVFRIRREIGAMAAALNGLDGLVFTGGIGENSAYIREAVCKDMEWLGISLAPSANEKNAREINSAQTRVLVIPTDEERVIARSVMSALE